MAPNTTVDAVVGPILIGVDVFDVMYRARTKNMAMPRRHIDAAAHISTRQGHRQVIRSRVI